MKQKQMMVIAVVCGLICAVCVALYLASVRGEADAARAEVLSRYGGEQVEAFVATRDIVAGERVEISAVETKLWVADLLPERAIRSSSDAVGKTATSSIYKGEVITSGRFEVGKGSIDVPSGKQAVSVPTKAVQAVGGAVRAGMNVDVYSAGGSSTTLIAQGVNVLDASVGTGSSAENGWITLAVEPSRVQEFIDASNKTTLYFTLPGEAMEEDTAAAEAAESTVVSSSSSFSAPDSVSARSGSSSSADSGSGSSGSVAASSGSTDSGASAATASASSSSSSAT